MSVDMSKSILVFSYFTNMPGVCQAEWIDDRLWPFIDKGYDISLISGTCCFTHAHPKIKHSKVPALSPHGAAFEYNEIHRKNILAKKSLSYVYTKLMAYVERVLEKLHIRSGDGRWTWFITSTIAGLTISSIKNVSFIYTTGGPASAHLSGIFFSKLFGKKVICEFEDPLSGKDIGRNSLSRIGLKFFEKRIIKYADCTIYCTKNAMLDARRKYAQ